jgi:hypothetical protein
MQKANKSIFIFRPFSKASRHVVLGYERRSLVALLPYADLLLRAKHLFGAAKVGTAALWGQDEQPDFRAGGAGSKNLNRLSAGRCGGAEFYCAYFSGYFCNATRVL